MRRHLHDLRRALPSPPPGVPWLLVEGETVQWNPAAPYTLDVAEFERLSAAPKTLAAAVPIYTEDLLPEVYDDWIFFERERLRDLLFANLERLTVHHEARGDCKRAIGYAGQILRHDPLREDTARRLMTLHYWAGDRPAALQEYRRIERVLRDELGAPLMPETIAAYEAIVRGAPAPELGGPIAATRQPLPPGNLPAQVTPFVGREEELAELRAFLCGAESASCRPSTSSGASSGRGPLAEFVEAASGSGRPPCRLLTLTGAGGSGKTRLSIELASRVLREAPGRCADGAWFVPLSLISDASLMIPAIADALCVWETARASLLDDVKNYLRNKRLLLVLDNFEHVTSAAPVVAELLAAAPGLSIIVTSRTILRLYGEQEYPLAPLPLPDPARLPPWLILPARPRSPSLWIAPGPPTPAFA